jgi:transposase
MRTTATTISFLRVSAGVEKMVYSTYKKQRILYLYAQGYKPPTIKKLLEQEKLKCSRVGIHKFLKTYHATGSIGRRVGSGRPSKITAEIKKLVEDKMKMDDETTAYQLHQMLTEKGYTISLRTILRCRTSLGWTFRGSAYCQLIREANKRKRLDWARQHQGQSFDDVIWTDESTIQMETHRRFACRKRGEAPRPKPR